MHVHSRVLLNSYITLSFYSFHLIFFVVPFFAASAAVRCTCGARSQANYTGMWVQCSNEECAVWLHGDVSFLYYFVCIL